jgi:hypothetical protein
MARSKPVDIGGYHFPKTGDALLFLKGILNSYDLNSRVSNEDSDFLHEAIKNHPECDSKVDVGIDHFVVRPADYGTRCFYVVRTDGTEERFSYKSCV